MERKGLAKSEGDSHKKERGCLSQNYNQISWKTKKEKTNKAEILRRAEITAWFFLMINVEFMKLLSWQKTFLASFR